MAHVKKPFWRLRNIVLMTIVLPFVMIAGALGWAVTRPMGQAGKFADAIDALVSERQPGESANAWPLLLETLEANKVAEKEFIAFRAAANQFVPSMYSLYEPWWTAASEVEGPPRTQTERREDIRDWIESFRTKGVFDKYALLAQSRRAVRPAPQGEVISMMSPELGLMRASARMLAARYALAAEKGDVGEMIASYQQLLAIARISMAQFCIIDFLVGAAIESYANERVREMMMMHPLEGEAATRLATGLLAAMDRERALMARVDHALGGERLSMLDSIEWTHTDDGSGGGVLVVTVLDQLASPGLGTPITSRLGHVGGAIAGLAFRGKATTVRNVSEMMEKFIVSSHLPRRARNLAKVEADMRVGLTWRDRLLSTLLPAMSKAAAAQDRNDLERVGLRTMLALELYRVREGHYPARLEDLVGRDLPLLEEDPIAGGPLRYTLLGDGVVDPNWPDEKLSAGPLGVRGYLLYSMGDDGIDNGGLTRTGNGVWDAIKDPDNPMAKGIDYLINRKPEATR